MSAVSETSSKNVSRDTKDNQRTDANKNKSVKNKENLSADTVIKVKSVIPRKRQELLKWYGWGYNDSMFAVKDDTIVFTGDRYAIGGKTLPYLEQWTNENFGIGLSDIKMTAPPVPTSYPESKLPMSTRQELEKIAEVSVDGLDRLIRGRGHCLKDICYARENKIPRIPDAVIWPESNEQVVQIVECASREGFVIIPYGGGTSVSGGVVCPANEPRPIVALDTSGMNSILWLDKDQLLATIQAGIVGQDLERDLRARGFTVGHEPDSYEFSTLGGWVATRASGMKKNNYGNIEDLVVHAKMVTPRGVIEKGCKVPRISCGPDWHHIIMGSEGCFGVVTEVTLKIRPLPPVTRYGSLVFPDWDSGVHFEREVARLRLQPSSIRLMDNEQFRFGQALKVPSGWLMDGLKRFYITRIKGFDPHKLCVVTLLIEGTAEEVAEREKRLNSIAAQFGGVPGGAENGERGYTLTFLIAYLRDFAFNFDIISESFETSVPWDRTLAVCRNVKQLIKDELRALGITHHHASCRLTQTVACDAFNFDIISESFETSVPWDRTLAVCRNVKQLIKDELRALGITHHHASCRLTQTYDAGCCLYFYIAYQLPQADAHEKARSLEHIEEKARDLIVASGGSISHHHGVGKLRKKWYTSTVSETGRQLLLAAKKALDPENIFAVGNLAFGDEDENTLVKSKL